MPTKQLFDPAVAIFEWKEIKTFLIRNQYNEILNKVTDEYFNRQYTGSSLPNFLNDRYCLTLKKFDEKCLYENGISKYTSIASQNGKLVAGNTSIHENVSLENKKGRVEWEWQRFIKYFESPNFFHLYFDSRSFFLVPKNGCKDKEEVAEIRQLLRSKIKK